MSVVGLLAAVASVFMAVPANASARPATVSVQTSTAQPAVVPGGFECVAQLKLFGYTITGAPRRGASHGPGRHSVVPIHPRPSGRY